MWCVAPVDAADSPGPLAVRPLEAGLELVAADGVSYRLLERVRLLGLPTAPLSRDLIAREEGFLVAGSSHAGLQTCIAGDAEQPSTCTTADEALAHTAPVPMSEGSTWSLNQALGRGAFGEVWRAVRLDPDTGAPVHGRSYVLKRMFTTSTEAILSGYREVHFGLEPSLRDHPQIARFVEHFTRAVKMPTAAAPGHTSGSQPQEELWLVFVDEGVSLHRLVFSSGGLQAQPASGLLQPAPFAIRLRTSPPPLGARIFRSIFKQLLQAIAAVHAASNGTAVHRDIKPSNILIGSSANDNNDSDSGRSSDSGSGEGSDRGITMRVRLADFGSAVDSYASTHLYGADGPTDAEETTAYAPPEVRLSGSGESSLATGAPYAAAAPRSYDMFAAGVTLLETLLAVPAANLFTPSDRVEAAVRSSLAASSGADGEEADGCRSDAADRAVLLAGLFNWCIMPGEADLSHHAERIAKLIARDRHHSSHHGHSHGRGGDDHQLACGLSGFRDTLRRFDAASQAVAERLAASASASAAGSAEEAGTSTSAEATEAADGDDNAAVSGSSSSAVQLAHSTALITRVTQQAMVAAFGSSGVLPLPGPTAAVSAVVAAATPAGYALPLPADATAAAATTATATTPPAHGMASLPAPDATSAIPLHADAQPVPQAVGLLGGEAGEDLLWRLLQWDPQHRITAEEALAHPYFTQAEDAA